MKKALFLLFLNYLFLTICENQCAYGQSEVEEELKNVMILSFGYTHIPQGAELDAQASDGFFVPTIGLDYGRVIGKRWELGLMLDYELDHYLIYDQDLEREKAFIAIVGVAYNLWANLLLLTGVGVEWEHNQSLFVYRLGADYSFHLTQNWAIVPMFSFDWKENYDTYAMTLGVKYKFN